MADFLISLGCLTLASTLTLGIWQRVAGPSESPARRVGRIAVATALGVVLAGAGVYTLSKSRTFQFTGTLVHRVETESKIIALTFDDGPSPRHAEEVLGVLKAHDASATFYLTGEACAENPALTSQIVDSGHELGNHTYSHARLYFLPGAAVADQIEQTDALLRGSGYLGPITVRPPGCKRLLSAPLYLARTGRTTVTWDLEPDSIPGIAQDPDAMVRYVVDGARPGSIVLMHVMAYSRGPSREALPRILQRLKAAGYRFVTVSELLSLRRR
jgi:peptidoglycan/xylan/chitin deacetylase (PgdA/CDA1 family)